MKPKKPAGIPIVAKDAPDEAVDFADQQIFAPADLIRPRPSSAPRRPMQQVLRELHDSEINAPARVAPCRRPRDRLHRR